MIADIALIVASWHPADSGLNQVNPGAIMGISQPWDHGIEIYAGVGGYRDSYRQMSAMYGGGLRMGSRSLGLDCAFVHVTGSRLGAYPIIPVPSFYAGTSGAVVSVSLIGRAICVSCRTTLWEF